MKQIFNNNENNAVKDRIFTPLYGVKLQDGLFCEVFHKNFEYLKKIDVDAALYWFRKKAGKMRRVSLIGDISRIISKDRLPA